MSAAPSTTRGRPGLAGRVAAMAAMAATAVLVVAGCSRGPSPEYEPGAAARAAQQALGLSPDQTTCLQAKLTDHPAFAAALNTHEPADEDQRNGYLEALRTCLPIEAFATLLSTQLHDAIGVATGDQARCVHDQVLAMTTAEADRLYLYFSNPAALTDEEIRPTSTALATMCKLTGR